MLWGGLCCPCWLFHHQRTPDRVVWAAALLLVEPVDTTDHCWRMGDRSAASWASCRQHAAAARATDIACCHSSRWPMYSRGCSPADFEGSARNIWRSRRRCVVTRRARNQSRILSFRCHLARTDSAVRSVARSSGRGSSCWRWRLRIACSGCLGRERTSQCEVEAGTGGVVRYVAIHLFHPPSRTTRARLESHAHRRGCV